MGHAESITQKLKDLCRAVAPPGPEHPVVEVVHELVHALRNPLSTFNVELYMARGAIDAIVRAAEGGDGDAVGTQAAELRSICDNLEDASETALKLLTAIEQAAKEGTLP